MTKNDIAYINSGVNENDPKYSRREKQKIIKNTIANPGLVLPHTGDLVVMIDPWVLDVGPYQRYAEGGILFAGNEYDERMAGAIRVNVRNKNAYVLDGNTRAWLARACGVREIQAQVSIGLTLEQEAAYFVTQDLNRRSIKPIERHIAELCYNAPRAKEIERLCNAYRLTPSPKTAASTYRPLSSISTCQYICNDPDNWPGLDWVFRVMDETGWLNAKNATTNRYIAGLFNAYKLCMVRGNMAEDEARIKKAMNLTNPITFQTKAMAVYGGTDCRIPIKNLFEGVIRGEVTEEFLKENTTL